MNIRTGIGVAAAMLCGIAVAAGAAHEAIPRALPGAPPLPEALRAKLGVELAARGSDYQPRTQQLDPKGAPLFTNRLLLEPSPYLQQHAHNPVNWFPWGDEAFAAARELGRPVLVSIGYSTCHWCHVMEEESFDNPDTARILNSNFIAIKVDREARPDIDAIYMAAIHAMSGRGGWPLNVFVTPDRQPFFAGTYFPPEDRAGRPGFTTVLRSIDERYESDPDELVNAAGQITAAIQRVLAGATATSTWLPQPVTLVRAVRDVSRHADRTWGGVGERMKFPSSTPIRMLLRYHRRTGDAEALAIATETLEKMAAGGIRDHVGGGFHRYATDVRWLVPHFEKMLYDNALLALAYLEAWQVTGRDDFAAVTREILDFVSREMTSPEGGFYSAIDADSPGPNGEMEEGYFFTWTPEEVAAVVGPETARTVNAYYGIQKGGNFEGRSIPHAWRDPKQVAVELGTTPAAVSKQLEGARAALYQARARRKAPQLDEKILVGWNGLMISAFARAGFALGEPGYVETARKAADFVLKQMRRPDARLVRVYQGDRAAGPAFLEDYAFLIGALLDLYEVEPDTRWITEAVAMQSVLDAHYADELGGGYFRTADDHEKLLAREKPSQDGAIPSGNSYQALNLLRLREYTLDDRYYDTAVMLFSAFAQTLEQAPSAVAELLLAVDYSLDAIKEVVVVRTAGDDAEQLLAPVRSTFAPNHIRSIVTEGAELDAHAELVPLVAGRRAISGVTTAYVCQNRVCQMPTSDPAVLAGQLAEVKPLEPAE